MKFGKDVNFEPGKSRLNFGSDPEHMDILGSPVVGRCESESEVGKIP